MEPPFERESGIVRIVGETPVEAEAIVRQFKEIMRAPGVSPYERDKTPEELAIIAAILQRAPEFVAEYGGVPVKGLSPGNFHMVDAAKLPAAQRKALTEADIGALYDFETQSAIVLPSDHSKLITAQRVVHEMLHFESFTSLNAGKGAQSAHSPSPHAAGKGFSLRRIGFGVVDASHTRRFFRDIDEAIIEELTQRFDERYFAAIPELAADLDRRSALRRMVTRDPNAISAVITRDREGRWETAVEEWRYGEERQQLRSLMAELYDRNRERFASEEPIFRMFGRAAFDGNLLPVARLVEETFGRGSFLNLGRETMIESSVEDQDNHPSS